MVFLSSLAHHIPAHVGHDKMRFTIGRQHKRCINKSEVLALFGKVSTGDIYPDKFIGHRLKVAGHIDFYAIGTSCHVALYCQINRFRGSRQDLHFKADNTFWVVEMAEIIRLTGTGLYINGTDLSETSCHSKGLLKRNRL